MDSSIAPKTYLSIHGGVSHDRYDNRFVAGLSVGGLQRGSVGLGLGVGYIHFDAAYLPLTIDFSLFAKGKHLRPLIMGKAGYGIYRYVKRNEQVKGGFSGSIHGGVSFPATISTRIFIAAGISRYSFFTTINSNIKHASYEQRYSLVLGINL